MPITNAEDLGFGQFDAQEKAVVYGVGSRPERALMIWDDEDGQWATDPRPMIIWNNAWIMDLTGPAPGTYGYASRVLGNPGQLGQSSYGWAASVIAQADKAFAANLVLEELFLGRWWVFNPSSDREAASVHYPVDAGSLIDNTLDPAPHVGVTYDALIGQRRWTSTGWTESSVQASSEPNLLPHLYARYQDAQGAEAEMETFTAQWRWTYTPA